MERIAIVRKLIDEKQGKVLVEFLQENELSNTCAPDQCSSCSQCSKQSKFMLTDAGLPVALGDKVVVYFPTYRYFLAISLTFILPIVLLLFGIYLGHGNEKLSFIYGGLFFAFSLLLAYIVDKKIKVRVIITRILERHLNG